MYDCVKYKNTKTSKQKTPKTKTTETFFSTMQFLDYVVILAKKPLADHLVFYLVETLLSSIFISGQNEFKHYSFAYV